MMTLTQIERKAIKECGKPVRRKIDRVGICDRYPDCATTLEVTARYKRRYEDGETD